MGNKTPTITIPQLRQLFTKLLHYPPPTPADIAADITTVLQRTEQARSYHYHKNTKRFPPRRRAITSG